MADMEQTGALPTATEDGAVAKYGTRGNVSVAGQKGVSLEGAQSADIRERLMQMIAERERGNPMQEAMGHLALAGSAPGDFNRNYSDYLTRRRQQEQDLLGMRVSAAQLASEEARLRQAAAAQRQFSEMVSQAAGIQPQQPQIGGAPMAQPQAGGALPTGGGAAPQPTAGGLPGPAPMLTPQQAATIGSLFTQNPVKAQEQFLSLTNPTEKERIARAAGLTPGTPEYAAYMRANLAGSGAFVPHNVRTPTGTLQGTPLQAAMGTMAPSAAAPAPTAPAAGPAMPAPAPAAPVAGGPAPAAPAPARPAATPTGFAPESEENLKLRLRQEEVRQDIEKEAAIESGRKIDVPEQVALRAKVAAAPDNLLLAKSLINDVSANKDIFGKLREPTVWSSVANLIDTGVQVGQFGSVSIPGIKDFVQQLDPQAAKDPKRLDAWSRVLSNMAKVKLNYAKVMLEGQGAVSDNERRLIEQAVGDASRDSATNMLLKAKAVELESLNSMEKNNLWNSMKGKMTWSQFTSSPQYKQQQRLQYYRTAKELRIQNPTPYPGGE
jgi:hypothetical protein